MEHRKKKKQDRRAERPKPRTAKAGDIPPRTLKARRRSTWLIVLLLSALTIKLIVLWQLHDHPLLQADAGLDTTTYAQLAQRVANGDLLLRPQTYFVSPLYVYFMAVILSMGGSFTAVRVIQIMLGACAVLLVFAAASVWFSERAAWCAAILTALAGVFTFYEVLLIQAALDPFLIAASLAALAWALRSERTSWFAVAGLCFGVAVLNRPNLLPAVLVIAVATAAWNWRRAVPFAIAVLAALAPVAIRNGVVAGDWSPLPSQGGLNFYIGNNPAAQGVYGPVPGIRPTIEGQQIDARVVASRALGHPVSDRAASSYFFDRGLEWIGSSPLRAATLYLRKIGYMFTASHVFLNFSYPFFAYDARTLLMVLFVGAWLLVPLGLTGLAFRTAGDSRWQFAIWASFVPVYALTTAAFFAADRYRLPLLIPLAVGAAGLLDLLASRSFIGRRRVALASAVVLVVAVNWPVHVDDGRAEERARMSERLIQLGRYQDADVWADRAEPGFNRPAVLRVRVGRQLLQAHQWSAAQAQFERAAHFEPDEPEVQYRLGQSLLEAGRPREAVDHLRSATARSPQLPLAGYHLARALAAVADREGALAALQAARPSADERAQNLVAFGELAIQLRAPQVAEGFLRDAVAADRGLAAAHQQLGLVLGMSNRPVDAERELREAVSLDPADPTAHLNLAVVFAQQGRMRQARSEALAALQLRPEYPQARQFLAALPTDR